MSSPWTLTHELALHDDCQEFELSVEEEESGRKGSFARARMPRRVQ